ncbi:MAG: VOC family protein [Planctomycetales bacterium]|nr:VOC family protein [Planctomycetales bacterium]
MGRQIYVNLPVSDVERSRSFFEALGFEINLRFSSDQAACVVISDDIYVMLLSESFFKTFTPKPIVNAKETTEVLTCLSCESRAEVDQLVAKAVELGGRVPRGVQDMGFMYGHAFEDLDGHIWELVYMATSES